MYSCDVKNSAGRSLFSEFWTKAEAMFGFAELGQQPKAA